MDNIIAVIILLLTFVGWIVNLLNENKQQPKKKGGQRPRKLQDEIDRFLNEMKVEQKPQRQKPRPQRKSSPQTKQRSRDEQRTQTSRDRKQLAQKKSTSIRERQLTTKTSSTNIPKEHLGKDLSNHVEDYIKSRKPGTLSESRQQAISTDLFAQMGTLAQDRTKTSLSAATRIRSVLQSPEDLRAAIMVNEILQRPMALRKR